jgi:O-methyltransferase involved in polyketide biosynthesis
MTAESDDRYSLVSHDLAQSPQQLIGCLEQHGVDCTAPAIFIAECCFMYLSRTHVLAHLSCIARSFATSRMIIFDPILVRERDPFSEQMIKNFLRRSINLESHQVSSATEIARSFEHCGWNIQQFLRMSDLEAHESNILSPEDLDKLSRLAALDEYEEWTLMSNHYYLAILSNGSTSNG